MKNIIVEQRMHILCHDCKVMTEHSLEVHSHLHFSWNENWHKELRNFNKWAGNKRFENFNEAYLAYAEERLKEMRK